MIDFRNHEDYADPTVYAALTKVIRQNRFAYICSPYRDNPRVNVMRARQYCKFAVSKGHIPLAPHLYFPQFMSEEREREKAMSMNFELLKLCGELWVFGDKITEGMAEEIAHAERLRKNIRYFTTKCEEVL
ncbi:DUF7768 domain-containing protein [Selenomonas sp. CM52]|uniref:DUF7768 domain-containing protein n=1 Tax=Selenomonas sp. CM52 TaxID=936381 RepID=UPI00027C4406|nr:DUF4406 domain-containing protein [Selenomonas sp. CM52]EJU25212.1 hypothetical protein HMPREF1153_1863 [Selenomonas sp. CM52]